MKRHLLSLTTIFALSLNINATEPLNFQSADISHIGIYIEDLKTGEVIQSYNDRKVLTPASVMKSVTAASVQLLIPQTYKFSTKVYPNGKIVNGTLEGDLIVEGSGDPTLGSRFFLEQQPDFVNLVVNHVKSMGIDSIAGDIVMDETCLPSVGVSPYWLQEDFAWEYGAGVFGINYRDNSFAQSISAGVAPKVKATDVEIDNQTSRSGNDEIVAMRGYDSTILTISGSVAKSYSTRYSLPSPAVELCAILTNALAVQGINVGQEVVEASSSPTKSQVMIYRSPSRDLILKEMMFRSDNLYAEGMLRTLAKTANGATKRERELWTSRGVNLEGSRWLDGSGLSPVERISPLTLGQILSSMANSDSAGDYINLFPTVGREGTVKSLLKGTRLEGKLVLKSGSMNGVKCYAGYKIDSNRRPTHVVVIMVNGFSCKGSAVAKAIETYLLSTLP